MNRVPEFQDGDIIAHVICWDGVQYDRKTTEDEISKMIADNCYRYVNNQHVFDFYNTDSRS